MWYEGVFDDVEFCLCATCIIPSNFNALRVSASRNISGLGLPPTENANTLFIYTHSCAAVPSAIYFACAADFSTTVSFFDVHETAPSAAKNTYPDVSFRLVLQPAQSALQNPTGVSPYFCPSNLVSWVEVPWINHNTFSHRSKGQRPTVGFFLYWKCWPAATAISNLLQIIKYI